MKRFRTAMAVAGFAFGMLAGCNDYNNSIQYNTGATLSNISPNGLPAGTGSFLLTVNANQQNGFNSTTVIQWNGQKLATDRKSTRLNSSHANISYAVFCLKKNTS